MAAPKGATERICEPMWTLTPNGTSQRSPARLLVEAESVADIDAELVFAQTGGDVGMGVGENVGINAQRKAGADFELAGARGKQRQFAPRSPH